MFIARDLINELMFAEQTIRENISRIQDIAEQEQAWYDYHCKRFHSYTDTVGRLYRVIRRDKKRAAKKALASNKLVK